MSAARTSITGFTTIPITDRVAGPTRRRVRPGVVERWFLAVRRSSAARRASNARAAAERAAAPAVPDPRDVFTRRHAPDELRRI